MEQSLSNTIQSNTDRRIEMNYTPRRRGRQHFSLGISSTPAVENDLNLLEELLHKTWSIFGVSTLFNFHQDELYLKRYAKRLREEVASSLTQEDVMYTTDFCVMSETMAMPTPMDSSPIKVEIFAEKNIEASEKKCIYKGIFLSWGTTKPALKTSHCIRLPVLLCRGTLSAIKAVNNMFSHMFDCTIVALPAEEEDLFWLIPIIIMPTDVDANHQNKDEIHLEYRIPDLPDTDTITVKFLISDLIKILTGIMKDATDVTDVEISFNLEHIEKFRDILYAHILKSASLKLGLCTLHKINFPGLTIMKNKMKITNVDVMNRVLLYFNEKCLDMFHTINLEV